MLLCIGPPLSFGRGHEGSKGSNAITQRKVFVVFLLLKAKKTDRGFAVKNHSLEDVFLAFCMKQSRRLGGSGPTERPEE